MIKRTFLLFHTNYLLSSLGVSDVPRRVTGALRELQIQSPFTAPAAGSSAGSTARPDHRDHADQRFQRHFHDHLFSSCSSTLHQPVGTGALRKQANNCMMVGAVLGQSATRLVWWSVLRQRGVVFRLIRTTRPSGRMSSLARPTMTSYTAGGQTSRAGVPHSSSKSRAASVRVTVLHSPGSSSTLAKPRSSLLGRSGVPFCRGCKAGRPRARPPCRWSHPH